VFYTDAKPRTPLADYDQGLVWAVVLLLGLGLVMVYSSSIAIAEASRTTGHQPTYYLMRHALFVAVSLAAAVVAFQIPMRLWQQAALLLFLFGVGLLVLVLVPGVGREVNGSQRWISLHIVTVQPSELMKLFVVLYAADYTVRKVAHIDSFRKGFLPMLIVMLVVGFVLLILASPYRLQRVVGFMDPWADPYGKGYQLSHALIAFGRGEWLGVGLGGSVEKLFYLPEAHTDFLLAVIAEELGFVGVAAIIAAFAWVVTRAFMIGRRAASLERYFAALVAQGIGLWIAVQAIINIGVNTGMLPTKGLTLPLVSFGGSALVAACSAIGVLLRVDWENRQLMRGFAV